MNNNNIIELIIRGFYFPPYKDFGEGKSILLEGSMDSRMAEFCFLREKREGEEKEFIYSVKESFSFEKEKYLSFSFKKQEFLHKFQFDKEIGGYIGNYSNGVAILFIFQKDTFSYDSILEKVKN
jgi:hypothetical protein